MGLQRYPNDFNGIAGAPAAIQAPLNGEYETWNGRANQDSQGNPILPSDKLALIHQAAIANCDGQDGHIRWANHRSEFVQPESFVVLAITNKQTV